MSHPSFVKGSYESLENTLRLFDYFDSVSGLKISPVKTQVRTQIHAKSLQYVNIAIRFNTTEWHTPSWNNPIMQHFCPEKRQYYMHQSLCTDWDQSMSSVGYCYTYEKLCPKPFSSVLTPSRFKSHPTWNVISLVSQCNLILGCF